MVRKFAIFLSLTRFDFPPFTFLIIVEVGALEGKCALNISVVLEGDLESDLLALFKIFALGFGVENLEA
ncbi:hypothetical protein [Trueperella pyogenes]|uniref:hypothetical protein n=1 Tax=Trueperella pyogenes TaxID=1661 RepID=UPI0013ED9456|nr:hypothetical protein [Trueperella pyogenes]